MRLLRRGEKQVSIKRRKMRIGKYSHPFVTDVPISVEPELGGRIFSHV